MSAFHTRHCSNITLSDMDTKATQIYSGGSDAVFSRDPIQPGDVFMVEVECYDDGWVRQKVCVCVCY